MKKYIYFLLVAIFAAMSFTLSSCSDDDDEFYEDLTYQLGGMWKTTSFYSKKGVEYLILAPGNYQSLFVPNKSTEENTFAIGDWYFTKEKESTEPRIFFKHLDHTGRGPIFSGNYAIMKITDDSLVLCDRSDHIYPFVRIGWDDMPNYSYPF